MMFITNQTAAYHKIHKNKEHQESNKIDHHKAKGLSRQERILSNRAKSFDCGDGTTGSKSRKRPDDPVQSKGLPKSAPGSPELNKKPKMPSTLLSSVISPRSMLRPSLSRRFESTEKIRGNTSTDQTSSAQTYLNFNLKITPNRSFNNLFEKKDRANPYLLSVQDCSFQRSSSLPELSPIYDQRSKRIISIFDNIDDMDKKSLSNTEGSCEEELVDEETENHENRSQQLPDADIQTKRRSKYGNVPSNMTHSTENNIKNRLDHNLSFSDKIIPLHAFTIFPSMRPNKVSTDCDHVKTEKDKNRETEESSNCFVHGRGLYHAIALQPASFYLECKTLETSMTITVTIRGPRILPPKVKTKRINSTMKEVEYWPDTVGMHKIFIKSNGKDISGSPFHVEVGNSQHKIWYMA